MRAVADATALTATIGDDLAPTSEPDARQEERPTPRRGSSLDEVHAIDDASHGPKTASPLARRGIDVVITSLRRASLTGSLTTDRS